MIGLLSPWPYHQIAVPMPACVHLGPQQGWFVMWPWYKWDSWPSIAHHKICYLALVYMTIEPSTGHLFLWIIIYNMSHLALVHIAVVMIERKIFFLSFSFLIHWYSPPINCLALGMPWYVERNNFFIYSTFDIMLLQYNHLTMKTHPEPSFKGRYVRIGMAGWGLPKEKEEGRLRGFYRDRLKVLVCGLVKFVPALA